MRVLAKMWSFLSTERGPEEKLGGLAKGCFLLSLTFLVDPGVLKNWGGAVGVKVKLPCLAMKGKLMRCGDGWINLINSFQKNL